MRRSFVTLAAAACLAPVACNGLAGQPASNHSAGLRQIQTADPDPRLRLELGAAASWTTSSTAATFAPSIAAEMTPIERRLEVEAGISAFVTRHSTEWDTDFLFKKPWDLSPKAEFMLGIGPEWVRVLQNGHTSDSVAGEIAGDFMFWPGQRRRLGWFLEPAYDRSFAAGHQQSISLTAGLLIGLGLSRRK